ncbi:crotonobetainyl-CoA--carnitine CoA-transferase [Aphanothece hegewaldii CCALA 016]|uniref:Crotonobetainyl-CoA--carnitine CoA-transferase n=1 Tax=Aphanothece hegewaldii CCALA 016 TaxID=2107694 RepID=A0A2T1LWW8_9CHRO|nr:DUF4347 domain-containing protein [Aphanothece hegewaldii]PSF36651.1 crotonobetainyl-CoA--carnitine CoA-transferase [Aphanothece hegewaldii CCALA 016]
MNFKENNQTNEEPFLNSLVFIDPAITDYYSLISQVKASEVILLDSSRDGIEQITETLANRNNITDIHLISHGQVGNVQLGSAILNINTLATYTDDFQKWSKSLTPDADLLFYGCNVAASEEGLQLLQQMSQLINADLAASLDLTGSAILDGDWELEVTTGNIETSIAFEAQITYNSVLDLSFNYSNFASTNGLTLNGNAATVRKVLQITPASTDQVGSVFYNNALTVDGDTSFQTHFQFSLKRGQKTKGAHGFVFMLQNSQSNVNALGKYGSYLGYGSYSTTKPVISKSLAVEFDTYKNLWDNNGNHVAILRDGNVKTALAQGNPSFDLNSGNPINAWIDYDAITDQLRVFLSETTIKPIIPLISYTTDLSSIVGSKAYVGFSAGTRKRFNAQNIENWEFNQTQSTNAGTIALAENPILLSEGNQTATVTFIRTGGSSGQASVNYTTVDQKAKAGEDYIANNGVITFANGETSKTLEISLIDDTISEGVESFNLAIDNSVGATLGTKRTTLIKLVDNDRTSRQLLFELPTFTVEENSGQATVNVILNGKPSTTPVTVNYTTTDDTAIGGIDYTTTNGTLTFASGEIVKTITVPIIDNLTSTLDLNKTFKVSLNTPNGAILGTFNNTIKINIADDDNAFSREAIVSGLIDPTAFAWTPDNNRLYIAQKNGIVRLYHNGSLLATPFIDISAQVNNIRDRGLLSIAVHPEFDSGKPYVYLLFTYDPPEVYDPNNVNNPNTLAGPDEMGNRPSRLIRVTADPSTNYTTALANSEVVILGKNSTWANISRPDLDSTNDITIPPSGITSTGVNIPDYLTTDSQSHSVGMVRFAPDGSLYVSNADGASYGRVDPRGVRVQDIDNLSGKIIRIDPLTGEGLPDNPFEDGDRNSNRSKVYDYGLRNPFRFTFHPTTHDIYIGDLGWTTWEEINRGRGANFGWPYYEGGNGTNIQQNGYSTLPQAQDFYNSGQSVTAPIYGIEHLPDVSGLIMGDFYQGTTFPSIYQGALFFTDINYGTVNAAIVDDLGIQSIQQFATGLPGIVQLSYGPDNSLYYADIIQGKIYKWSYNG